MLGDDLSSYVTDFDIRRPDWPGEPTAPNLVDPPLLLDDVGKYPSIGARKPSWSPSASCSLLETDCCGNDSIRPFALSLASNHISGQSPSNLRDFPRSRFTQIEKAKEFRDKFSRVLAGATLSPQQLTFSENRGNDFGRIHRA